MDIKRHTNANTPFNIHGSVKELSVLDIEHWQCLSDAIKTSEHLEKLSLLDPITEESSKAIYEALKENQSVHTLMFQDLGSLDTVSVWWLAKLIEESEGLARLDLISKSAQNKKLHGSVMKALNANQSIMWLTIEKIGFAAAASLKDLAVSNTSIAKLVLSKNQMNAEQFMALCEGLKHNHSIKILDISHNNVGDEGMRVLSEVLQKNRTLRTLNMTELNYTASGLQFLGGALKQNGTLKTLKLSEKYDLNDGAQFIGDSLRVNESLTALKIHETFTLDGLAIINEAIKFNRFLMELEFSGLKFSDECAESLAEAMKINTNIEHLSFKQNNILDYGAGCLFDIVPHNQSLTSLDLTYVRVASATADEFFYALKKNVSLLSVEMLLDDIYGGEQNEKELELAGILERNVLLQYARTIDMLVLFFNVARNPITFPKDIWRLIFCYYKTPGVPTFEPLLNEIFQDHTIRRVPAISKF